MNNDFVLGRYRDTDSRRWLGTRIRFNSLLQKLVFDENYLLSLQKMQNIRQQYLRSWWSRSFHQIFEIPFVVRPEDSIPLVEVEISGGFDEQIRRRDQDVLHKLAIHKNFTINCRTVQGFAADFSERITSEVRSVLNDKRQSEWVPSNCCRCELGWHVVSMLLQEIDVSAGFCRISETVPKYSRIASLDLLDRDPRTTKLR